MPYCTLSCEIWKYLLFLQKRAWKPSVSMQRISLPNALLLPWMFLQMASYTCRKTADRRRTAICSSGIDGMDWKTDLEKNFLFPAKASSYVQNSSSPVGCIFPPHLGQVCISHLWILSDPHLRQSLPTRELKLGAASPITPPTTRGTMFLQSGQDMASMCCPMKPRPSYISVSYPHSWHLNIFFFDINNLLFYQFKTQLALEYFPMEKWFVFWLRKKSASFWLPYGFS